MTDYDNIPRFVPDDDNRDPWAAGYAAGLRAHGNTLITDDEVDPRVVVVRMLPHEFMEEAIATGHLIELNRHLKELARKFDLVLAHTASTQALAVRLTTLERRMARIESNHQNQATTPKPLPPGAIVRNDSALTATHGRRPHDHEGRVT
jgi:hypothetical protein